MNQIRVGVLGCAGRNGSLVLKELLADPYTVLSGGTAREGGAGHGADLGVLAGVAPLGVYAHTAAEMLFKSSDVLIDFTTREATLKHVDLAVEHQKPLVIGTTGFTNEERKLIITKSDKAPIMLASNFSSGVAVLNYIVEFAASVLNESFDAEILEVHHRHKKDSPSGTAKSLVRAIHRGRKNEDKNAYVFHNDLVRQKGDIGVAAIRGGEIFGSHTVLFLGNGESLELKHESSDRSIYAKGALRAAKWIYGKAPGLYRMRDVLKSSEWVK